MDENGGKGAANSKNTITSVQVCDQRRLRDAETAGRASRLETSLGEGMLQLYLLIKVRDLIRDREWVRMGIKNGTGNRIKSDTGNWSRARLKSESGRTVIEKRDRNGSDDRKMKKFIATTSARTELRIMLTSLKALTKTLLKLKKTDRTSEDSPESVQGRVKFPTRVKSKEGQWHSPHFQVIIYVFKTSVKRQTGIRVTQE
ncbi:hypothetical protein EVAR_22673_1 [Eumeta japonica]|uniref:Uncharacterized protein n=1 Tax=Eumeta variegata TaxID=151549 RepID=A0A4C1VJU8_EUMVA|nr:hypothetical protein EVAR_22673_1 [Eumeta japonica]